MSVSLEKISEVMQQNEEKKNGLRKSLLMLMVEWKNFEEDLELPTKCIKECFNELESKDKHLASVQESVSESCKELDLIRESVEVRRKEVEGKAEEFVAFREREIYDLECKWKGLILAKNEFDESVKSIEEKMNVEQDKIFMKEKEFEECAKELKTVLGWIREESDSLRLNERKFEEQMKEFQTKEESFLLKEKEFESKERSLNCAKKEHIEKENSLVMVERELRVKETDLESLNEELREKEHNLDSIQKKLTEKETDLESFDKELREKEHNLDTIQKKLTEKETNLESSDKEVREKEHKLDSRQKKLMEKETNFESVKKELIAKVSHLATQLTIKQVRLSSTKKELESKERGLDSVRRELIVKENSFVMVKAELRAKEIDLDSLQKKLRETEHNLDSIQKELIEKETNFHSVKKELEGKVTHLGSQLTIKEDVLSSMRKELELKDENLNTVERKLDIHEQQLNSFKERLQREGECDFVKEAYRQRLEELDSREKMVEHLKREGQLKHKQLESLGKSMEKRFREISKKEENFMKYQVSKKVQSWIREKSATLDQQVAEVQLKEKIFESLGKELETKQRGLDSWRKELTIMENCLDSMKKDLGVKEENLSLIRKELELKDKSLDTVKKKLELQETEFKERLWLMERELDSVQKAYRQCLKKLYSREKKLDSAGVFMNKCLDEFLLENKKFQIEQGCKQSLNDVALKKIQEHNEVQFKVLEEKEKQLKTIANDNLKTDPIDDVAVDKVSAISSHCDVQCIVDHNPQSQYAPVQREADKTNSPFIPSGQKPQQTQLKQMTSTSPSFPIDTNALSYDLFSGRSSKCVFGHSDAMAFILMNMGGKNLQSFLNDHSEEHELLWIEILRALKMSSDPGMLVLEALEGFCPLDPHKEETGQYQTIIRKSCILLLEHLMRLSTEIKPEAKLEATKLALDWKAKMIAEIENHQAILAFLLLVGAYRLASAFDRDELKNLCCTVAHYGIASQIFHVLGISGKDNFSPLTVIEKSVPHSRTEPLCYNVEMRCQECNLCSSSALSFIHCTSSPAKLVLDALRKCYSANLGKLKNAPSVMERFSDLLEELREVSPEIRPEIQVEAIVFAVEWRATLIRSQMNPADVLGFLHLLATYELWSSFDPHELRGLLKNVYHSKKAVNLFKIFGLSDMVPRFIEKLIRKELWPLALKYMFEYELVDLFPPVPLLKNNVLQSKELVKKECDNGHCTLEDQEKAINSALAESQGDDNSQVTRKRLASDSEGVIVHEPLQLPPNFKRLCQLPMHTYIGRNANISNASPSSSV